MQWMMGKTASRRGELARWRAWLLAFYISLVGSSLYLSSVVLPVRILEFIPSVTKPVALDSRSYERAAKVAGEVISISSGYHDPWRQRTVLSLTCTPLEIERLYSLVDQLLNYKRYDAVFDAIHVAIPRSSLRFNESYPSSGELQQRLGIDRSPRIIVHRTEDVGPLTRYIAPVLYERHPDTRIVVVDVDSQDMEWQRRGNRFYSARFGKSHPSFTMAPDTRDLLHLVHNSQKVDPDAVWCLQGEDFVVDEIASTVRANWDTFTLQTSGEGDSLLRWNQVHFCRATGGVLVKPRHFQGFQYNQTSYHPSCFWDDDRWIGFQMESLGTQLKVLQPGQTEGGHDKQVQLPQRRRLGALSGLTELNRRLHSQQSCTLSWMTQHPASFPTARSSSYS